MLLVSAIMGAVNVVLSIFWQAVRGFVLQALNKLKQILGGILAEAVNLFVKKGTDGLKELAYNYVRDGNRYLEKIVSKHINESDLPQDIRSRVNNHYNSEVDITEDFQHELQLS